MAHKPYGLNELREMYLKFFETKGHLRLPSFSLEMCIRDRFQPDGTIIDRLSSYDDYVAWKLAKEGN